MRWSVVASAYRFALQLGAQVKLARLQGSEVFGVFAIGLVLLTLANFISGPGWSLSPARKGELLQRRREQRSRLGQTPTTPFFSLMNMHPHLAAAMPDTAPPPPGREGPLLTIVNKALNDGKNIEATLDSVLQASFGLNAEGVLAGISALAMQCLQGHCVAATAANPQTAAVSWVWGWPQRADAVGVQPGALT